MTTCPNCNHTWGEKSPQAVALDSPLPKPARKWPVDSFVATWADGTETRVSSVPYKAERTKWAAAFQAADRLRRLRLSHKLPEAKSPGATVNGPCGVTVRSPAWWDYVKAVPAPALASLRAEDGGAAFVPSDTYGAGDPEAAEAVRAKLAEGYVIQREDGRYVTRAGSRKSYTVRIDRARVFPTREVAESERCGNERVTEIRNA